MAAVAAARTTASGPPGRPNGLRDGKPDDWEQVENRPWAASRNRDRSKCLGQDFVKHHNLVPMYWYWSPSRSLLKGQCKFPLNVEGPPGRAHGASIAMVFDEVLAYPVWRLIEEKYGMGVTANLSVSYDAALPLGDTVEFECRVDKVEGRKWFVSAELFKIGDLRTVYARGTALFIAVAALAKMGRKHFLPKSKL